MATTTMQHRGTDVEVPRMEVIERRSLGVVWGLLRLFMGWTFLWAFLDKLFGLGFSTGRLEGGAIDFGKDAWISGGSPTFGLQFFTKGPFKGFFADIAGQAWLDWLFMGALLLVGLGLMLGVMTRIAAIGGAIWMGLFYTATAVWPEHNPFLDEHIVYIVVLAGIAIVGAGRYLGLGKSWERLDVVRKHPFLA